MAIRFFDKRIEFDYESESDGSVAKSYILYLDDSGINFNGIIYGTETSPGAGDGATTSPSVLDNTSGAPSVVDFEIVDSAIHFGLHSLKPNNDGTAIIFNGIVGATLTSAASLAPPVPASSNIFIAGGQDVTNAADGRIDKFPIAISGATASDVGDLAPGLEVSSVLTGHSSSTDGFIAGGDQPSPSITGVIQDIQKFPFAISGGTASDVGNLTLGSNQDHCGSNSPTDAFITGGRRIGSSPSADKSIEKFPFAISGGVSTDVGDLLRNGGQESKGHSSSTDGFISGGLVGTAPATRDASSIEKYPFSISGGTSSYIGNLLSPLSYHASSNSSTHAYSSGGLNGILNNTVDIIQKFSFVNADNYAVEVGVIQYRRSGAAGSQSSSHGFVAGGFRQFVPNLGVINIDKFPFAIVSASTQDVGDLNVARDQSPDNIQE